MKKWSTIISDEETVEIGGKEVKLKIKGCLDDFAKMKDLQINLMKYENNQALDVISDMLVKIGFISKNIQMGQ